MYKIRDRSTQTKHGKGGKSVGLQAFEEDPWGGLLSRQEICDLIEIDSMVGLGMKDQPEAKYHNHSVTSKRIMMSGVVYQVVVLKEQYMQEKEVTKVEEIPSKEKIVPQET